MRRQLALTTAAIATMIVVAFVVPLALLVRTIAEDRAVNAAEHGAEALAPALATVDDPASVAQVVDGVNASAVGEVTVFLADGTTLGVPSEPDVSVDRARSGQSFTTRTTGGVEVLIPVIGSDGTADVVRAFVPDAQLTEGVGSTWLLLGALGVGLVLVAVVVADRLGRSIVRPVNELADVAERLSHGDLHARVEPAGPPEVVEVGQTLNQLATRIDGLLEAEREAVADLSHRLRTPVTALRLDVDGLHDAAERERVATDVDALTRAIDRLIVEARRPVREGVRAEADLAAVTRERVAFWAALADEQHRAYRTDLPDTPCIVGVTADDLAAAIDALLNNVIAHTPDGSAFTVRVTPRAVRDGRGARLTVDDSGSGFPVDRPVLERGESGGTSTGLGLDIVRTTAEATGGTVTLGRSELGGGRVTVDFGPPTG